MNARALRLADQALFVRGCFADALAGDFDLIVSNPPYVATDGVVAGPSQTLRYDASLARRWTGDRMD